MLTLFGQDQSTRVVVNGWPGRPSDKPPRSIHRKEAAMRITAIAVAGLVAGTLLTASPAQATPSLPLSPQSDAQDVRQQIADLDAEWDGLTPGQRNQRFTQIQQGLTKLDFETRNVPQDQKAGVDLILLPALGNLGSLYQRVRPGQR
jgi:hypothetical protein